MRLDELREQNTAMEEKLKTENAKALGDLMFYLSGKNLSETQLESIRYDLLVTLVTAEERGEGQAEVFGEDLQAVGDAIVEALPPLRGKAYWCYQGSMLASGLAFLMGIELLTQRFFSKAVGLLLGQAAEFTGQLSFWSLLLLVTAFPMAMLLYKALTHTSLKKSKWKHGLMILWFLYILLMALGYAKLGPLPLFDYSQWVYAAIALSLAFISFLCAKVSRHLTEQSIL